MSRTRTRVGLAERTPTAPRCLSVPNAARQLGVGVTTMRSLIASGAVESIVIGRRRLCIAESLDEFVQRCRVEQRKKVS